MMSSIVYLIPSLLHESAVSSIPPIVLDAIKDCKVFFVENERSARRYLKSIWKEMHIDSYEWYNMEKEEEASTAFRKSLKGEKHIGIISEAGCPGVADPGQVLVAIAHEQNAIVRPLPGPSSILLALMASGMNGQQFQFLGYLPIDNSSRNKRIRELEMESAQKKCTQIFIETPYRNNQLMESLVKTCRPDTILSIAVDLTAKDELIRTDSIKNWSKKMPELHKRPAIFSLLAKGRFAESP